MKPKVTAGVAVAILLALAALLGITILMYRDSPTTGDTPGTIDNAQGVAPKYPPATPVEPAPAKPDAR